MLAATSVIVVLGLYFLSQLSLDLLPQIVYPQERVRVSYPGVAAEVMEEQVEKILETSLATTENVTEIETEIFEGQADVSLHFSYGTNVDFTLQDASKNLDRAPLAAAHRGRAALDLQVRPLAGAGRRGRLPLAEPRPGGAAKRLDLRLQPQLLTVPGSRARILLSEVADVRDTRREQRLWSRLDGVSAVKVSVRKQPDANMVAVAEGVADRIAQLRESHFVPPDIHSEVVADQSFFIRNAVKGVTDAAMMGAGLAMLVVLRFLGSLRKTSIIGRSTPLALGLGEGSEMMRPLAITVVSGLTVSTLLTMVVLPCAYLIVQTVSGALARLVIGRRREPAGAAAGAEAGTAHE